MKFFLLTFLSLYFYSCGTEFEEEFCPSLEGCTTASSSTSGFQELAFDDFNRANEPSILSPWTHVQGTAGDDTELLSNAINFKRVL